ncbi:hypothetical protein MUP32_02270 [Candidatus Microgenomates bacterium]|nr:hypothetical protein [Candidatus Microgenomates bacterium]
MNRKEFAIIALMILLTVIAWIFFSVYGAGRMTSLTEIQLKQVVPLTPTFDNDIIKQLQKRED